MAPALQKKYKQISEEEKKKKKSGIFFVPKHMLRHLPDKHVSEQVPTHVLKHLLTGTCLGLCLSVWLCASIPALLLS